MLKSIKVLLLGMLTMILFISSSKNITNEGAFGIDVSRHNGDINWSIVKKHNKLLFVYVKATEGATYVDPSYDRNISGARNAGYLVGSYHYFRMTSSSHSQFKNFIGAIGNNEQDLIPMVDVETTDKHSYKETRDSLNVFLRLVKAHFGKAPMIYATNRSYNEICGASYNNYHLYIGRYGENAPRISGKGQYSIWQYSQDGSLRGIPKPVDLAKFNSRYSVKDIKL